MGRIFERRYRVVTILGMGAMATVYEAEHLGLRQRVALKVLHPEYAGERQLLQRFFREARTAAMLKHRAILDVRHVDFTADGLPYIESALLTGESLDRRLDRAGCLGPAEAVRIALEVLEGLAVAHAHGVVHRDIKPANLFLASDATSGVERAIILDLGIAKSPDELELTERGQRLGTPLYMSPEQLENSSGVDARADLYALGATLFDALAGEPPIVADTLAALFRAIQEGRVRRHPARVNAAVPPWLDEIVARAMAPDPRDRFQTAEELARSLEAAGRAHGAVG